MAPLKLHSDRLQCRACFQIFSTSAAFDRHCSAGRCLSVPEMEALGMQCNSGGFWIVGSSWCSGSRGARQRGYRDAPSLRPLPDRSPPESPPPRAA
jgi:hypothetical protein